MSAKDRIVLVSASEVLLEILRDLQSKNRNSEYLGKSNLNLLQELIIKNVNDPGANPLMRSFNYHITVRHMP
jgi:hypothetical protein